MLCFVSAGPGVAATDELVDHFSIDYRNFMYRRDFELSSQDREDYAIGGIIRAVTHEYSGLRLGFALHTSQEFLGLNDDNKAVYNLLKQDGNGNHEGFTTLAEAFIQGRSGDSRLTVGRQKLDTPWANKHDSRLTPKTFEALHFINTSFDHTDLILAHATKMKNRDTDEFRPMSEIAGFNFDRATSMAGVRWNGIQNVKLQAWYITAHDMWQDYYVRTDYQFKADKMSYLFSARHLKRDHNGEQLAGFINTHHAGLTASINRENWTLKLAHSNNGSNTVLFPWGHDLVVSIQVGDANRADEVTSMLQVKYQTIPGQQKSFHFSVLAADFNTPESGTTASPDILETNYDARYYFSDALKGLMLRAAYAVVDASGTTNAEDARDTRFMVHYYREF